MSKGRRKSDPGSLQIARLRVQQWKADTTLQYCFSAEDRHVLQQICRLDLISIIEEDLGLSPLKSSQKNSVACMISFLLAQQRQARRTQGLLHAIATARATGGRDSSSPGQQGPGSSHAPAAAAAGADGWSPSSADGSCPTPSTAPDGQQPQQLAVQLPAHTQDAAAPAADMYSHQPWLAELHEQLEAAGTICHRLGDDTTDTDEDTAGTEADSGWLGSRLGLDTLAQQDQQQPGAGSAQALAPALDTTHIEDMLVQQLLLDISSEPRARHRAHKSSSFSRAQPGEQEDQRQPPLLLQQKLQQLEEQQQQLKQQQMQQQQELRRQQLMQQQQRELEREMQAQADFDQMLHEELLHQLQKADPAQLLRQPVGTGSGFASQQLRAAAPAAPEAFAGPQQLPAQVASWPLPIIPGPDLGSPAAALQAAAPVGAMPGAAGLPLHGLSDAALPAARQGPRLSLEGGGSFTRKREKMLMDLPTLQDEAQTECAHGPELCVEPSGPSAELPTKRMSITLPGCTEVAALPTSFSGRVPAGPAGMTRPQATDLQQLMQFSSCDDAPDMLWQQQQQQPSHVQKQQVQQMKQYQYQYDQQQLVPDVQQGGPGAPSLASRLKTMLRGKKAHARRYASVSAGGSFGAGPAAAAAPPANRIHSADAALAQREVTTAGSGQLEQWGQPQFAGQQMAMGYAPRVGPTPQAWGPQPGSMPDVASPAAADGRLWHSMAMTAVHRDVSDPNFAPATVGAFSWHAERSTMLAGTLMPGQAAAGQHMYAPPYPAPAMTPAAAPAGAAAGNSQFAQQLAQLRAEFGVPQHQEQQQQYGVPQQQEQQHFGGFGRGMQDTAMPAQGAAAGAGGTDFAGPSFRQGAAAGLVRGDRPAAGLPATSCSTNRPGLMGKLVRALTVGSVPAHSMPVPGLASMGMDVHEDAHLLVMGRSDGELDLARAALQWQADNGPLSPEAFEAILESLGVQRQDHSSSRLGCGMDQG